MAAQKVDSRKTSPKGQERAGVTHSPVYDHFKSEEDLFNQSVTNLIDQTVAGYRAIGARQAHPVEPIEDRHPATDTLRNRSTLAKKITAEEEADALEIVRVWKPG